MVLPTERPTYDRDLHLLTWPAAAIAVVVWASVPVGGDSAAGGELGT